MTRSSRNGLLPGISAHGWCVVSAAVFACFFGGLALIVIVAFIGFATDHPLTSAEHPVFGVVWLVVFEIVVVLIGVTQFTTRAAMRRELRAGYSTLPLSTLSVDIRDPRDGRILLPAGEGPRAGIFGIRALRRDASRYPDRPLDTLTTEPEPIRRLDIPGGPRGLIWGRARLAAFHAAVAASEPDALLIDALRHPLVEGAVASFRPGARVHYTYLLAVLPSGLQLWQDTERPALIAEIPRAAITDVGPESIMNDRLPIPGIAISIFDPAGNPTELPFLPLRPAHPVLFVKSDDIPALIDSIRRKLGMSAS